MPPGRSGDTVGYSTDGHGRAAQAAFSGLEVNSETGRAIPSGRPAARVPSRKRCGQDGTGGRPFPPPGYPELAAGSRDHGDIRTVSVQGDIGERLPAARRPP